MADRGERRLLERERTVKKAGGTASTKALASEQAWPVQTSKQARRGWGGGRRQRPRSGRLQASELALSVPNSTQNEP